MPTPTQPNTASAHTPGPWQIYPGGKGEQFVFGDCSSSHPYLCGQAFGLTADQCAANARLIAAAPELLAALESVMQWTEGDLESPASLDCETIQERITFIKSAIARATGKGGAE